MCGKGLCYLLLGQDEVEFSLNRGINVDQMKAQSLSILFVKFFQYPTLTMTTVVYFVT